MHKYQSFIRNLEYKCPQAQELRFRRCGKGPAIHLTGRPPWRQIFTSPCTKHLLFPQSTKNRQVQFCFLNLQEKSPQDQRVRGMTCHDVSASGMTCRPPWRQPFTFPCINVRHVRVCQYAYLLNNIRIWKVSQMGKVRGILNTYIAMRTQRYP